MKLTSANILDANLQFFFNFTDHPEEAIRCQNDSCLRVLPTSRYGKTRKTLDHICHKFFHVAKHEQFKKGVSYENSPKLQRRFLQRQEGYTKNVLQADRKLFCYYPRQSLAVNIHCELWSRFHSDSKRIRSGFESKRRESPQIHNVFAQQYGFANFGRVFTVIRCETLSWVYSCTWAWAFE